MRAGFSLRGWNIWLFRRVAMRTALLLLFIAVTLTAALVTPRGASAAESDRFVSAEDTVSLVSKNDAANGTALQFGLLFRLSKGWHIYWKNAGDAGSPPQLTLTQPARVSIGAFAWPAPEWLITNSLGDYVLSGTVLLPFAASLPDAPSAQGIDLHGNAQWLVCSAEICVPQHANFTLHLAEGSPAPSMQAGLFAAAHEAEPGPSPFTSSISARGILTVTGSGLSAMNVRNAHFFPDLPDAIVNAAPQKLGVRSGSFSLALKPFKWSPNAPLTGVLEITDGAGNKQSLQIIPTFGATKPVLSVSTLFWSAIGALLGGVLLNLMPCVFPVLAIKAMSVVQLGGESRRAVRAQSLAYTAGVVVTMLIIGGALESLRAAGAKLGWGFQLQSPAFVAFMAWLVFAIGLNLIGAFEFTSRFANVGSSLAGRRSLMGSFVTGLVAVAVATPCTAPFMGAAIASALAAPSVFGLGIFFLLGIGLSLPFLLLGFFPEFGALLPRPGKWMETLRQLLAFPMFATTIWLLWVVARQAGATGVFIALTGMMLLGFAVWLLRFQSLPFRVARFAIAAGTLGLLPFATPAQSAGMAALSNAVPYAPARLAALRAAGTPVLIDMSAAWCITCLVNERVVLDNDQVRAALHAHHAIVMTGDWTNRDPVITSYLEAEHRDGVPLYVYYPPHHAMPVILPQVLTPSLVQRVLRNGVG
ncbi:MAG TPA: thioredoxin family protein [Acidocella sp.]|jgi:thiol:disulfide interchange protein|uniref:protein-disulfide reductase DsbD family protein n=1 Tax=Acidocella sp. TaxID=50710 RepID=UPI002C557621|nr:thioredoxin family protein [Acidocella sp.]HVE23563.1 thioredoxin family protein [Acidocella sp.]